MDFLRDLYERQYDGEESDISSRIKAAEKSSNDRDGTKGFALENEDGTMVKVFVREEQSEDFERALSRELLDDNGEPVEIPELLYELRKSFDIVDVEWGEGAIPEDEEEMDTKLEGEVDVDADLEVDTDLEGEGGEEDLDMEAGDELDDSLSDFEGEDESDAYSALDKVIDMMKADAEAKKAEAEAKKAQAETELARESLNASKYRAAQEEEILDMENHNKQQSSSKKQSDDREKLIKYRHELKNQGNLGESMKYPHATPEEEEILNMEDDELREKNKKEHNAKRERLLKFRHKKRRVTPEDEEHAKTVNYKQKKDTSKGDSGMSKAKASGKSFQQYDSTKGSVVDQKVKLSQVADTSKGDSGMSHDQAKGSIHNKAELLAKMAYYGERLEDGDLKSMTFIDFQKIEELKDEAVVDTEK